MCGNSLLTSSSPLSPQAWPFHLNWLPQPAYLVGGIVRDALLGRYSPNLDLDFVMPAGAVETARAIARHHHAGFVLLDAERQIARVVFERATTDFAQQVGPTLEIDLQRRDFTMNAIAYNPHNDQLIDPLQGYEDLQRGLLRMIAPENLEEDPLRLLRAYRQSAQLGFRLEPQTQQAIRQLADLLSRIAAERIQAELSYLLSTPKGTPWLKTAWQDGLLNFWFPHATPASLDLLAAVDQAGQILADTWPAFEPELSGTLKVRTLGQRDRGKPESEAGFLALPLSPCRRTWLSTMKLLCLLSREAGVAEAELQRLKYSRTEIQAVVTVLKHLTQVQSATALQSMSRREQYFFFQSAGAVFPGLAILAVASGIPVETIAPLMERFLCPNDPVAHPVPLITGQDLMNTLKLSPGPQIGRLLAAVQLAQAEGKVETATSALEFAALLQQEQQKSVS